MTEVMSSSTLINSCILSKFDRVRSKTTIQNRRFRTESCQEDHEALMWHRQICSGLPRLIDTLTSDQRNIIFSKAASEYRVIESTARRNRSNLSWSEMYQRLDYLCVFGYAEAFLVSRKPSTVQVATFEYAIRNVLFPLVASSNKYTYALRDLAKEDFHTALVKNGIVLKGFGVIRVFALCYLTVAYHTRTGLIEPVLHDEPLHSVRMRREFRVNMNGEALSVPTRGEVPDQQVATQRRYEAKLRAQNRRNGQLSGSATSRTHRRSVTNSMASTITDPKSLDCVLSLSPSTSKFDLNPNNEAFHESSRTKTRAMSVDVRISQSCGGCQQPTAVSTTTMSRIAPSCGINSMSTQQSNRVLDRSDHPVNVSMYMTGRNITNASTSVSCALIPPAGSSHRIWAPQYFPANAVNDKPLIASTYNSYGNYNPYWYAPRSRYSQPFPENGANKSPFISFTYSNHDTKTYSPVSFSVIQKLPAVCTHDHLGHSVHPWGYHLQQNPPLHDWRSNVNGDVCTTQLNLGLTGSIVHTNPPWYAESRVVGAAQIPQKRHRCVSDTFDHESIHRNQQSRIYNKMGINSTSVAVGKNTTAEQSAVAVLSSLAASATYSPNRGLLDKSDNSFPL